MTDKTHPRGADKPSSRTARFFHWFSRNGLNWSLTNNKSQNGGSAHRPGNASVSSEGKMVQRICDTVHVASSSSADSVRSTTSTSDTHLLLVKDVPAPCSASRTTRHTFNKTNAMDPTAKLLGIKCEKPFTECQMDQSTRVAMFHQGIGEQLRKEKGRKNAAMAAAKTKSCPFDDKENVGIWMGGEPGDHHKIPQCPPMTRNPLNKQTIQPLRMVANSATSDKNLPNIRSTVDSQTLPRTSTKTGISQIITFWEESSIKPPSASRLQNNDDSVSQNSNDKCGVFREPIIRGSKKNMAFNGRTTSLIPKTQETTSSQTDHMAPNYRKNIQCYIPNTHMTNKRTHFSRQSTRSHCKSGARSHQNGTCHAAAEVKYLHDSLCPIHGNPNNHQHCVAESRFSRRGTLPRGFKYPVQQPVAKDDDRLSCFADDEVSFSCSCHDCLMRSPKNIYQNIPLSRNRNSVRRQNKNSEQERPAPMIRPKIDAGTLERASPLPEEVSEIRKVCREWYCEPESFSVGDVLSNLSCSTRVSSFADIHHELQSKTAKLEECNCPPREFENGNPNELSYRIEKAVKENNDHLLSLNTVPVLTSPRRTKSLENLWCGNKTARNEEVAESPLYANIDQSKVVLSAADEESPGTVELNSRLETKPIDTPRSTRGAEKNNRRPCNVSAIIAAFECLMEECGAEKLVTDDQKAWSEGTETEAEVNVLASQKNECCEKLERENDALIEYISVLDISASKSRSPRSLCDGAIESRALLPSGRPFRTRSLPSLFSPKSQEALEDTQEDGPQDINETKGEVKEGPVGPERSPAPSEATSQSVPSSRPSPDGWEKTPPSDHGGLGDAELVMDADQISLSSTFSSESDATLVANQGQQISKTSKPGVKSVSFFLPRTPVSFKYKARDVLTGKAKLKVSMYCNCGLVTVHVIRAARLISSRCRQVNAYVKVSLYPNSLGRASWRTAIVRSNNPTFDQKFSFEILSEDSSKRLLLTVWHRDLVTRRSEFLGCMSFGVEHVLDNTKRINGWYRLLTEAIGKQKHFAAHPASNYSASLRASNLNRTFTAVEVSSPLLV